MCLKLTHCKGRILSFMNTFLNWVLFFLPSKSSPWSNQISWYSPAFHVLSIFYSYGYWTPERHLIVSHSQAHWGLVWLTGQTSFPRFSVEPIQSRTWQVQPNTTYRSVHMIFPSLNQDGISNHHASNWNQSHSCPTICRITRSKQASAIFFFFFCASHKQLLTKE